MQSLKDRVAMVTGGTSGIGAETVLCLARAGAHVVLTGRRAAEGEGVAERARQHGVKAEFVQGDVTNEGDVERAVAVAVGIKGRLDLAFNNAGVELAGSSGGDYGRRADIEAAGSTDGAVVGSAQQLPLALLLACQRSA
jgi:NAD(P)-dependent dehydrogenase (short-subunit alcohol dehydrogenase family)